jgi:lysophospholipase L1-like esterase
MNVNRKVLYLVLSFTVVLLAASVVQFRTGLVWKPLGDVNLVSEIVKDSVYKAAVARKKEAAGGNNTAEPVVVVQKKGEEFRLYTCGGLLTDFDQDTTHPALADLMEKLFRLKKGSGQKIRIAYIGDSMLEGDLITQTFRKLMQQQFGGSGVGFVPIMAAASHFRQTIQHTYSGNWEEHNFKGTAGEMADMYISGHRFFASPDGSWVSVADNTIPDSATITSKYLLCGKSSELTLEVNGAPRTVTAGNEVNQVLLATDAAHRIKLALSDSQVPVYGVSIESDSGVVVDNFSFRGVSGVEFAKISEDFLSAIQAANRYDLVILQYGANLMFRPNDKNYSWYYKIMDKSVKHLRSAFGKTPFLLVSTADRAFKYDGEYKTAVGIDSLIRIQATLANNNNCSFYNLYASMGGNGTIVKWANSKPPLANKDYVHPNFKGAEILGKDIFAAFVKDYNKYVQLYKK